MSLAVDKPVEVFSTPIEPVKEETVPKAPKVKRTYRRKHPRCTLCALRIPHEKKAEETKPFAFGEK